MRSFKYRGAYLREARESKDISQGKLAKKLGIHVQFISNWERGICEPPLHARKKLFKELKLNKSHLQQEIFADYLVEIKEHMLGYTGK